MESILLQGLNDDDIRQFMHVLDVMQSNLVETGMIGDEKTLLPVWRSVMCGRMNRKRKTKGRKRSERNNANGFGCKEPVTAETASDTHVGRIAA